MNRSIRTLIAVSVAAAGWLVAGNALAQCRSCGRHHSQPTEAMVWPLEHEGQVAPQPEAGTARHEVQPGYYESKKIKNTPQYHYTGAPREYYLGRSYKTFPHYNDWYMPLTQKRIDYRKRCRPWRPW